jgi:SNF2 family DNA or RNA helicase
MKVIIDFKNPANALITTSNRNSTHWETVNRIIKDVLPIDDEHLDSLLMSWHVFLNFKNDLAKLARIYNFEIILTDKAKEQLQLNNKSSYITAIKCSPIEEVTIIECLKKKGFRRSLTPQQLRNICKLTSLPAAATFSVPGAGKTTEALAYFFFHADKDDKLLVVAPKNAFPAWDEQLNECCNIDDKFQRLVGGYDNIRNILKDNPRFTIIAYKQFSLITDIMIKFFSSASTFMFLDESHRIKGGLGKKTVEPILRLSFLPKKKLIMSGTPMPQSDTDLDPQIHFLYPELNLENKPAIELIKPIYVRTTKPELGLKEPIRKRIPVSLTTFQQEFYNLLKSETARQIKGISRFTRADLRKIGKSIMKLMQFVSNPALLAQDVESTFSKELSLVLINGGSIKVDYACERARQLAHNGEKSIIWTSFVKNVELIAVRLEDIGADYIHGGVDAGDDAEADTREGKIKKFHDDKNAMVLVANPAAASEGISLHKVCHTAIYVDRSFNAAHYLQSEDRIHRLGLPPDIITNIEIIECKNTIDEIINERLTNKVARMAEVLNDNSLNINADEYAFEDDDVLSVIGIEKNDAEAIISYLIGDIND